MGIVGGPLEAEGAEARLDLVPEPRETGDLVRRHLDPGGSPPIVIVPHPDHPEAVAGQDLLRSVACHPSAVHLPQLRAASDYWSTRLEQLRKQELLRARPDL